MSKFDKFFNKVKSAFDFEAKRKNAKWEAFKKEHATKIAYLPTVNGRKVVPAIWNKRTQEWVWVTRAQRRNAKKVLRRRMNA